MKKRKYSVGVVLSSGSRQTLARYANKRNAARMEKCLRQIMERNPDDVVEVYCTVGE